MSDFLERIAKLSPKRLALLALELQTRVEALEGAAPEPLAIVGLGCRFPGGADSPAAFWELLRRGADAITEVPRDRWDVEAFYDPDPDAPGKMATRFGGFLRNVDRFDAQFFGITPREAASMDPQQRLLLEVAWEALEDAGQAPDSLTGSATGVFVGMCNADYFHRIVRGDPSGLDAYVATGGAHSVAAGRLAYVLGLQGPNVAIDTACSSSLVAIHLACQSLRAGECRMALAGGVNLILAPETTIILSRAHMMAPDGRCKAFDARADGFVRAEGCGLVVLKRLCDAEADGDTVLAIIRGTAINQDGRSNGLTAPNGPAQEAVLRSALANAGIAAHEVAYVEAHGTGTSLGDPIEMRALGAVLGADRSGAKPLIVGSLKTNIGHLEAAAGVAGLIKVILALRHGEIPAQLHFQTPNPHIPWRSLSVMIADQAMAWPEGRRVAGVSSFGFSGTNAHLLLEAAPDRAPANVPPTTQGHVLILSARSEPALRELAGRWADHLATSPATLADLCATASTGRAQMEHRLAVPASSTEGAREALARYGADREAPGVVVGRAPKAAPDVVFLFPGQGAQYPAMGGGLYEEEPVFRAALDRCAAAAQRALDLPLAEVLYGRAAAALEETAYTQVGLFAVEWALAEVWRAWGVRPSLVLGHSVGEYVAACVAGVLDVEAAVELVAARGRLMGALPRGGAMAAVPADEPTVAGIIAGTGVVIAAVNGPESVVVSGEAGALEAVLMALKARGIEGQRLRVAHAFHSPLMDPMLAAFEAEARRVRYASPQIGFISTVTGEIVEAGELDAEYWVRQVREPVRYAAGLAAARAAGSSLFLELGPQPVLTGLGQAWLEGATWVPTLRRGRDDCDMLRQAIGRAWVHGVGIDWRKGLRDRGGRMVAGMPTYPFQRERHWLDPVVRSEPVRTDRRSRHPLVGERVRSAVASPHFESRLDVRGLPFLADHRIHGLLIAPSPVYLEMAAAASAEVMGHDTVLSDFSIEHPMVLVDGASLVVQTLVSPGADGSVIVEILSADDPQAPVPVWRVHARASASRRDDRAASTSTDARLIEPRGLEEIAAATYYEHLRARGLDFGPAFRGIERVWRGEREALAEVRVPGPLLGQSHPYRIHPAVLDACLQVLGAAWPDGDPESYLLTGAERVNLVATDAERLRVHATLRAREQGDLVIGDVRVLDDRGAVVAELGGIQLRRARAESLARYRPSGTDDWLYEVAWPASPLGGASRSAPFASPRDIVQRLDAEVAAVAAAEGLGRYDDLLPGLESLSYHYALDALTTLGWRPKPGDRVTAGPLAISLGIETKHERLLGRLLEILGEEGALRSAGDGWEVPAALPRTDTEAAASRLTKRFPDSPELALTMSCGRALGDVLRGRTDPLQLLFSPTAFATTERLYTASPGARTYNTLVARVIRLALERRPPGRRVRILEIGAGTGGTTAAVLPELPDAVEYVFTDVSPAFTARASETFTAPFLSFRTLDIERDPDQQGFAGERFDIVLAANVLHATRDLRQTLAHVGQLLEAHGLLMLLEGTARQRWVDLTFGLTEGWWRFTDVDLRPTHALLRAEQWLALLEASGLVEASALPSSPASRAMSTQAVLLARGAGRERPADDAGARAPRDWLLLADRGGLGAQVAAALEARGDRATMVYASADDIGAPVRQAIEAGRPWHGVIHLWSLDAMPTGALDRATVEAEVTRGCESVVTLVRALAAERGAPSARLWLVTRGAQTIGVTGPEAVAVTQTPLWGLGRVVALEHPDRWGGLVDVDPRASAEVSASEIVAHVHLDDGEDQVAFRAGERHVPRLSRRAPPGSATPIIRADGAYLVTGGLGGLGLRVARWLADQGARDLVLLGRRGLPARTGWAALAPDSEPGRQAAAVAAIEALGARVRVVAGDVTDHVAMAALFATFDAGAPRLRGIVHAAAGLQAETLEQMQPSTLAAVLGPKVTGAWLLHELSRDLDLDFFVLFSSTTALLGARRLGAYAAANQFLDGLAHHRRHAGQPAISINWGTWDQMQVSEEDRRGFVQTGLLPMRAHDALATLGQLLTDPSGQVAVAAVDWGALTSVYEARRRRPFLERLAASAERPIPPRSDRDAGDLIARVNAASAEARGDLLLGYVRDQVGAVLRLDPSRIDVEQGLFDMGMDSLMALDVKTRLETAVNRRLPSTLTFNYPTVTALAAYLASEVLAAAPVGAPSAPSNKPEPSRHEPETRDDDLSEEELAAMLAQKLEGLR